MRFLFALLLLAVTALAGEFTAKPYLQLGDAPQGAGLVVMWHTPDAEAAWNVRYRTGTDAWRFAAPGWKRVRLGAAPHRVYRAPLTGLKTGQAFDYEVLDAGKPVFAAQGRARKGRDEASRFVVIGDSGAGTPAQRRVAHQIYQAKPDYVFITGDIVYSQGRISEYRSKFFPAYNADTASPLTGAPLLRSTVFTAAPGNHDYQGADLSRKGGDGLAFFYYWSLPLNGPVDDPAAANTPPLRGSAAAKQALFEAAGAQYPRMANFSFDYGTVHWISLDSNPNVDWADPAMLAWLEKDLQAAQGASWRVAGFHHPPFNSSRHHWNHQWMRRLAPLFEKYKVAVVFAGHVHNYQRSYPLTFVPEPGRSDRVNGKWTLDREYDGSSKTEPKGPIYLVTGAGGAGLYNRSQFNPRTWQEYTVSFEPRRHSFTLVEATDKRLSIRQITDDGSVIDEFAVTR